MTLLKISDLHLTVKTFEGTAKILNGVDLSVGRGQIVGVVGETGCGKSVTGLSVSRLLPTPAFSYPRGSILFEGKELIGASEAEMRPLRGRRIGMVFQDPTTNLNPVFRIGEQMADVALTAAGHDPTVLGEAANLPRRAKRRAVRDLCIEFLGRVGVVSPERRIDDYAHQFSGGMRQRVLIAMALIGRPALLIADEPTTALDVSVQAQVLKLLQKLAEEMDLGVMLITHNLGVVSQYCTHVNIMYAGKVVEHGPARDVLRKPEQAYTKALIDAIPRPGMPRGSLGKQTIFHSEVTRM